LIPYEAEDTNTFSLHQIAYGSIGIIVYTKLPMYLSTNQKPTYIVSTDVPFENRYFNRAVSLAIRRAVGERSMLATATTNAKTSTAATTNTETERSFVALVVIILTATRHLARRLVPRSNEPTNKPTNERTNKRTIERTNKQTKERTPPTNEPTMGKSVKSQLAFAGKKCHPIKSFFETKIPMMSDLAPRSAKTQMAMTASTAYAAESNKNTTCIVTRSSVEVCMI